MDAGVELCLPALKPLIRVSNLDATITLTQFALLHASQGVGGVEGVLELRRSVLKGEVVVAKGHFGQREA